MMTLRSFASLARSRTLEVLWPFYFAVHPDRFMDKEKEKQGEGTLLNFRGFTSGETRRLPRKYFTLRGGRFYSSSWLKRVARSVLIEKDAYYRNDPSEYSLKGCSEDLWFIYSADGYEVINEQSLKLLHSYLDDLHAWKSPTPVRLHFYVQEQQTRKTKLVILRLDSHSIVHTVRYILRQCYLDNTSSPVYKEKQEDCFSHQEIIVHDWEQLLTKPASSHTEEVDIREWLKSVVPIAQERLAASWQLKRQNASLTSTMCSKNHLKSLGLFSEWTAATKHGYLRMLERLMEIDSEVVTALAGSSLSVGFMRGLSPGKSVYLHCEDTLQQWSQLVEFFKPQLSLLDTITDQANQFAKMLGLASVTANIGTSLVALHHWLFHYVRNVQRLDSKCTTKANTVLTFFSPEALRSCQVSPSGGFEVPLGTTLHELCSFLSKESQFAIAVHNEHMRTQINTEEALKSTQESWELSQVGVTAGISPQQVIQCCLKLKSLGLALPTGLELQIGSFRTVTQDGTIIVPANL